MKKLLSKEIIYSTKVMNISYSDRMRLQELGLFDGRSGINNTFKNELSDDAIKECASILEVYYGKLTAYSIWNCDSINCMRIVFGNPLKTQ